MAEEMVYNCSDNCLCFFNTSAAVVVVGCCRAAVVVASAEVHLCLFVLSGPQTPLPRLALCLPCPVLREEGQAFYEIFLYLAWYYVGHIISHMALRPEGILHSLAL